MWIDRVLPKYLFMGYSSQVAGNITFPFIFPDSPSQTAWKSLAGVELTGLTDIDI
jgi:hypothetical protein